MKLPVDAYSPDQLSALIMELRQYTDAQADASRRSEHAHAPKADISALLQSAFDAAGDTSASQLLEELEALLKGAPVVHIITAGRPGTELRQQITTWFRSEIHEHTLLAFVERHDLGGGVVVRAGSHIYDFSFKRKILDNKRRITELAFGPPPNTADQEVANVR